MALLERVNSMKDDGLSESQIANALIEEGYSPTEVNEAISQSTIKAAVSPEQPQYSQEQYDPNQYPQTQEAQQPEQQYSQEAQSAAYYPPSLDMETVKDIAEQVAEENLKKIVDELSKLNKSRTELKFEMQDIENRLGKIESVILEVQTGMLKKVREHEDSIQSINQELKATQDSFSKILNPFLDKKRNVQNIEIPRAEPEPKEKEEKGEANIKQKKERNQKGASFEDYFR